jgi:hypothetical protein
MGHGFKQKPLTLALVLHDDTLATNINMLNLGVSKEMLLTNTH